jgi:hypothetical protein
MFRSFFSDRFLLFSLLSSFLPSHFSIAASLLLCHSFPLPLLPLPSSIALALPSSIAPSFPSLIAPSFFSSVAPSFLSLIAPSFSSVISSLPLHLPPFQSFLLCLQSFAVRFQESTTGIAIAGIGPKNGSLSPQNRATRREQSSSGACPNLHSGITAIYTIHHSSLPIYSFSLLSPSYFLPSNSPAHRHTNYSPPKSHW